MPEGHTIHRLAARYRSFFAGRAVAVESPQGRFAAGAAVLDGLVLNDTEAVGKHLLFTFGDSRNSPRCGDSRNSPRCGDSRNSPRAATVESSQRRGGRTSQRRGGDHTLHIHLGLYGKFSDGPTPAPPVVGEVRLRVIGPDHWLDLRGPAACELLTPAEVEALRDRLGADPLRDDAVGTDAFARIGRSPTPITQLLLNQEIVAGTGLIFVTEALFRARIHPLTPGRSISAAEWDEIWADLRALMKPAVVAGRIDTVRAEHLPEAMGRPPRVDRHGGEVYAYRRAGQPCLICGTAIASGTLGGRNLYWCPTCQQAD